MATKFKIGDRVTTHKRGFWLYGGTGKIIDISQDYGILLTDFKDCEEDRGDSETWFNETELVLKTPAKDIKKYGYKL